MTEQYAPAVQCDCDERSGAMWRLLRHVADGPTPEAQAELAAALVAYRELPTTKLPTTEQP